ncbi:MAG TPA: hypothetical protein VMJ75_04825 [Candidatus Acidoferrales bacterium]|nr:hypothetical protein [Candidatus Acidoferrales bacterium]
MDNPATIQELEVLWRQRVQEAKVRYDLALAEAENLERNPKAQSRAQAEEAVLKARAEYMRFLRIWDDLVAHGKIPQE